MISPCTLLATTTATALSYSIIIHSIAFAPLVAIFSFLQLRSYVRNKIDSLIYVSWTWVSVELNLGSDESFPSTSYFFVSWTVWIFTTALGSFMHAPSTSTIKLTGSLFYPLITKNSFLNVVMELYYLFRFQPLVQLDLFYFSKLLFQLWMFNPIWLVFTSCWNCIEAVPFLLTRNCCGFDKLWKTYHSNVDGNGNVAPLGIVT